MIFYDPLNALPLYEWSHIAASYNGKTGYIALSFNGEISYEAIIPELVNTSIIPSAEPLYFGFYCNPMVEFGVKRQSPAGLIDEVKLIILDELMPKSETFVTESYEEDDIDEID